LPKSTLLLTINRSGAKPPSKLFAAFVSNTRPSLPTANASCSVCTLQSTVCRLRATIFNNLRCRAGLFPLETRQTIGDSHCHFWPVFSTLAKSAKCTKLATGLESRWGGYCCCFCNCSYCSESKESQMTANTRSQLTQSAFKWVDAF